MRGIGLIRLRIGLLESPCECGIEPPDSIIQLSTPSRIMYRHLPMFQQLNTSEWTIQHITATSSFLVRGRQMANLSRTSRCNRLCQYSLVNECSHHSLTAWSLLYNSRTLHQNSISVLIEDPQQMKTLKTFSPRTKTFSRYLLMQTTRLFDSVLFIPPTQLLFSILSVSVLNRELL